MEMAQTYNIYIVNQSSNTKNFWLFLKPPQALEADPGVFANSSACLTVDSQAQGTNTFGIPLQYKVGAGASNQAVGLDIAISSNVTLDAELGQAYQANYQEEVPPKKGPKLVAAGQAKDPSQLQIISNNFDQPNNEEHGWFANMSFGIQSADGFIGMTWSPAPGDTRSILPQFSFYISTGDYDYNSLAKWTDISTKAATVKLSDFKQFSCTVTLNGNGTWTVTPGRPPQLSPETYLALLDSHHALSQAHASLVALAGTLGAPATAAGDKVQVDTVTNVRWSDTLEGAPAANTFLKGKLTVATALTAAFGYFILSGLRFRVTHITNNTLVDFEYNGPAAANQVRELVHEGVQAEFHRD
jgi:hypothetical protein